MKIKIEVDVPKGEYCFIKDKFLCGLLDRFYGYHRCKLFDETNEDSVEYAIKKCLACLRACEEAKINNKPQIADE